MFKGDEFDALGFATSLDGNKVAESAKTYAEWFPDRLHLICIQICKCTVQFWSCAASRRSHLRFQAKAERRLRRLESRRESLV